MFETDKTALGLVFRAQLAEAKSESERARIRAQLEALADSPASGSAAFWNGQIWVADDDIPF